MSDLIPPPPALVALSNDQRRAAALTLAELFTARPVLAYYLVQLGLAEHHEDGTFVSTPDRQDVTWFSRLHDAPPASFVMDPDLLDDCR